MSQKSTNTETTSTIEKWQKHEAKPDLDGFYVTNPAHGGKVTCEKCSSFIDENSVYWTVKTSILEYTVYIHDKCYNAYEHYYGLNKPID